MTSHAVDVVSTGLDTFSFCSVGIHVRFRWLDTDSVAIHVEPLVSARWFGDDQRDLRCSYRLTSETGYPMNNPTAPPARLATCQHLQSTTTANELDPRNSGNKYIDAPLFGLHTARQNETSSVRDFDANLHLLPFTVPPLSAIENVLGRPTFPVFSLVSSRLLLSATCPPRSVMYIKSQKAHASFRHR